MTEFMTNPGELSMMLMCNELTAFVEYPTTLYIEYPKSIDNAIAEMFKKINAKKVTDRPKELKSNNTYSYDTINPVMEDIH